MVKKVSNFKKSDVIFTLLGAAFMVYSIVPLIKSIFSSKNNYAYTKKEEWVELPLTIEG
jgi:hypothetical protein